MNAIERYSNRWIKLGMLILSVALVVSLLLSPQTASAHASLVEATPAAGSELGESPTKVKLIFNERLENGLFELKVFDAAKNKVTDRKPVLNNAQTELSLELPQLDRGIYLATYRVISADGHPVEGSYLFAVGQQLDAPSAAAPDSMMDHLHGKEDPLGSFGAKELLLYSLRIAFYAVMLTLTGWVLWNRYLSFSGWVREQERHTELQAALDRTRTGLQQAYVIIFLLFMGAHLIELLGENGTQGLYILFGKTVIGYAWITGLVLSMLSFVMLGRGAKLELLWIGAVWLDKGLLGHAAAMEPRSQTLLLDWLHLGASAVWIGGLVLLLSLMWRSREAAAAFLPIMSRTALLSIILLAVSGTVLTFIYLPNIRHVLITEWGRWLIAKTGIVLLVIIVGGLIRYAMKKQRSRTAGMLVRIDAAFMAAILVIVGCFTYMSPHPENKPLYWHVMGETIHMTTQISPKVPGVNEFTVKVWLPEQLGKPKQIMLKVRPTDTPDIAPLLVPLEPVEDVSIDESYGMMRHTYKGKGAYLPYAGRWQLEVRVMDAEDNETVYSREIDIY
ncbi:copper resistance CopC/CopD family protein [Paenibacillus sp. YYML68]|uniref:copper resistance CopC/CopD family protein n=1 Tax=Paenibacillus sp. YYML68 TaxID=2909250 RepID=UPI002492479B|nr:copper resistance protein CopC [Paenibacillus sp. YYML68]